MRKEKGEEGQMDSRQWQVFNLVRITLIVVSTTLLVSCKYSDVGNNSLSGTSYEKRSCDEYTIVEISGSIDCERTLGCLRIGAEQGDPFSLFQLGLLYNLGECVLRDYTKGFDLIEKSAVQGYGSAQVAMGHLYTAGRGRAKNPERARMWYLLATKQGEAEAQMYMGEYYFFNQSESKNYEKAAQWYRLAAAQGNSRSQLMLGYMYREGWGVEKNFQEAFEYFRNAAKQGDSEAQYNLGWLYYNGEDGIKQNYMEAFNWYVKAARNGNDDAREALIYLYGDGTAVSAIFETPGGLELFRSLMLEFGSAEHQYNEGLALERGYEGPKNYTLAAEYYKKAAEKGLDIAQERLDAIMNKLQGVDK